jgi:hypothetical protein
VRTSRLLLILFVIAVNARAQEPEAVRSLDVVVMNQSGAPVTTLTRDSFTVLEDAFVREIHDFTPTDAPWSIVLLLDRSATQSQTEGIDRFIARLRPRDRIAIASFGDKVETLMDWKDRTAKVPSVRETPDGTVTTVKDLFGAVKWATGKLQGVEGRKAAIFVTDGHDRRLAPQWLINDRREEIVDPLFGMPDLSEAEEFRRLNDDVMLSGVRFYFLAIPPDFGGRLIVGLFPGIKDAVTNYILRVRRRMERLAEVSHGHVLYGNSLTDVISSYGQLYDTLRFSSLYTLQYSPGPRSETPSRIEVRVKDASLRALYSRNP